MRIVYVVSERDRPWIVLFSAQTLEALADCLAAQPDHSQLHVSANDGVFTRPLNHQERRELAQLVTVAAARAQTVTPSDRSHNTGVPPAPA